MTVPQMTPQLFTILSSLVAQESGLHFDVKHHALFSDKVAARAADAGFASLLDYYYFLRYDDGCRSEMTKLIEALVVGETYLFREFTPLEVAVSRFVQPAIAHGRRARVWSAACATGEEPHTLAMLLAARGLSQSVDLVASDISEAALQRARTGVFNRRAIRGPIPAAELRWLTIEERAVRAAPALTESIAWHQVNLMSQAAITALGTFDVIFCRNVLIYFSDDVVRKVVETLAASLRPGGALFVGVSESLLRFGTRLRCEDIDGVFCYRNHHDER